MHLSGSCTLLSLAGLAFLCQDASAAPSQQVPKLTGEVNLDCSKTPYNIAALNLSSNDISFQERVLLPDQQNLNTTPKANQTVIQALDSMKTFANVGSTTKRPVNSDVYLSITVRAGAADLPEASVDELISSAHRTAEKKPSTGLLIERYENRIPSRWMRALDIVLDVDPIVGTMNWGDFGLAVGALWEFYHRAEDPPPQCKSVFFEVKSQSRGPLGQGTLHRGYNSLPPTYGGANGTVSNACLTSRPPPSISKPSLLLLPPAAV